MKQDTRKRSTLLTFLLAMVLLAGLAVAAALLQMTEPAVASGNRHGLPGRFDGISGGAGLTATSPITSGNTPANTGYLRQSVFARPAGFGTMNGVDSSAPDVIPATQKPPSGPVLVPPHASPTSVKRPAAPQSTLTVDTTSTDMDGDTSSVSALLANRGPDGTISLAEAIAAVNHTGGGNTINFDLPHGATIVAPQTWYLDVPNTIIDGDTNGDSLPDVFIDEPPGVFWLVIRTDGNVIRYLANAGLALDTVNAHDNRIIGNYVGTDVEGRASRGQDRNGIEIKNGAHDNSIEQNIFAGNAVTPPGLYGVAVYILGGSHDNVVRGNRIGVNVDGNALPNLVGVDIISGSVKNIIGGSRATTACVDPCNVISGNATNGVFIAQAGTISNVVQGNYIGLDPTGSVALSNGWPGVWIGDGAAQNLVGGDQRASLACNGPCNVISGNGENGIRLTGAGTNDNMVQGNYIGVNATGSAALPNGFSDPQGFPAVIVDTGAAQNIIGGPRVSAFCDGPCNVISGNSASAVAISGIGTISNVVTGNYVGVNPGGTAAMPNGSQAGDSAVAVGFGATANVIGGARTSALCNGPCNVISGNLDAGLSLSGTGTLGNVVLGNYIGLTADGTGSIANGADGVSVMYGASQNIIGGPRSGAVCDGPCNVIGGNLRHGISLRDTGTSSNIIEGNYVGVKPDGSGMMSNAMSGVAIAAGAAQNTIGGLRAGTACDGPCNVISGNAQYGVLITAAGTISELVRGNYIGMDPTAVFTIPNHTGGVAIYDGASQNMIGGVRAAGSCAGVCNLIRGNTGNGVTIVGLASQSNTVRGNEIRDNGGLGIDLGNDGLTRNDPGDTDNGPNGLQNFPVITSVSTAGGSTTIQGVMSSTANTTFNVEFFANVRCSQSRFGEGELYLGSTPVTTDGSGAGVFAALMPLASPPGYFVTATATDPNNNTSEFSRCFGPWTLMYYLDSGTNLFRWTSQVFNQLESVANNPATNIIVLWDRPNAGDTAYYEVQYDTNLRVMTYYTPTVNYWPQGELNMGDPATLSNFVNWARNNYPAQYYALIMVDHGNGIWGSMDDDLVPLDRLTVSETGTALATATQSGAHKIDVLQFYACLMGMVEDAYQVKNYVNYYVASENEAWDDATPFAPPVAAAGFGTTPLAMATSLAQSYAAAEDSRNAPHTVSVADISQINYLSSTIQTFGTVLQNQMATAAITITSIISPAVQRYDNNGDLRLTVTDTFIDLYDFARLVKLNFSDAATQAAAQDVMTAVGAYVTYEHHRSGRRNSWFGLFGGAIYNLDNSHGVSIFFADQKNSFYTGTNLDFAAGTTWPFHAAGPQTAQANQGGWGSMLVSYLQVVDPNGPDEPAPLPLIPPLSGSDQLFLPLVIR